MPGWFLLGLAMGAFVGFCLCAVLVAGSRADDWNERKGEK